MSGQVLFLECRNGKYAIPAADDTIGVAMRRYGEWAQAEIDLLMPLISPGDLVIDAGANIGSHTIPFARAVGPQGTVIAFEAQARIASLLSWTVTENGFSSNVLVLNAVVGSEDAIGSIPVSRRPDLERANFGAVTFSSIGAGADELQINAPLRCVTIDGLGLPRCDVIKMDIEGMELAALRGARRALKAFQPIVYFEFANDDRAALDLMLQQIGGEYRYFAHYARAFNPNNFKNDQGNIFGPASELNILALPPRVATAPALPQIWSAADLPAKPADEPAPPPALGFRAWLERARCAIASRMS